MTSFPVESFLRQINSPANTGLDSFHGDSVLQEKILKELKSAFPKTDVIAGNVVTMKQAKALLDAGADALRVGMSAGSI